MTTLLPVNTRIRFIREIIEPACGDHPTFLLAEAGTYGTVVGHGTFFDHSVLWDGWKSASFGANINEDFVEEPTQ